QTHAQLEEAYESIPFTADPPRQPVNNLLILDAEGNEIGPLTDKPQEAAIVILDRKGHGLMVKLDRPRPVFVHNNTLRITLASSRTKADNLRLEYTLIPYSGDIPNADGVVALRGTELAALPDDLTIEGVAEALAGVDPHP